MNYNFNCKTNLFYDIYIYECFNLTIFQIGNIYKNVFKQKDFIKAFSIYMYFVYI